MLGIKAVYPALPKFIRQYPVSYYLKDMRKRIKKQGGDKWQ
jgi:outer membrane protein assembly factor BamD (BamD/ComL family)